MGWVTNRGHCTLDYVLEDLYEIIQQDVEEINEILKHDKKGYQYIVGMKDGVVIVAAFLQGKKVPTRRIIFEKVEGILRSDRIKVRSDPKYLASFSITWSWNAETDCCDFSIQGEKVTLQEISRTALEAAFFENPVNP